MDIIAWASIALTAGALISSWPKLSVLLSAAGFALALWYALQGRWHLWPVVLITLATAGFAMLHPLPLWFAVFSAAVLAGTALLLFRSAVPHTPPPTGQHKVGMRRLEFQVGDTAQQVYLWYPADPAPLATPRRYFTAQEAKAFGSVYRAMGVPALFTGPYRLAQTHSYEDAALARHLAQVCPALIFNHGGAMAPLQSLSLMEALASHGFIVLAMTHPGESAGIAWADGSITAIAKAAIAKLKDMDVAKAAAQFALARSDAQRHKAIEALKPLAQSSLSAVTRAWSDRTSAMLDAISNTQFTPEVRAIFGATTFDKVGFIGMSMGGSVSHDLCQRDKRAVAGVNLDGINWRFEWAGVPLPTRFLQIHADPDLMARQAARLLKQDALPNTPSDPTPLPNDIYYKSSGQGQVKRYTWQGRSHMFFTDQPLTSTDLQARQDHADLNALVVAFLSHALGSAPAGDIDAIAKKNPRLVELKTF
ncbi:MAG: hypothetical protein AAF862_00635 [Pseudomonadota bacterium]